MCFVVKFVVTVLVLLVIPVELQVIRPDFIVSSSWQIPPVHDKVCPCPIELCVPYCSSLGVPGPLPSGGQYFVPIEGALRGKKCAPFGFGARHDIYHFCCRPHLEYIYRSRGEASKKKPLIEAPLNDTLKRAAYPADKKPSPYTPPPISTKGFLERSGGFFTANVLGNPWFASIIFVDALGQKSRCSGVLIDPSYLISAANCLYRGDAQLVIQEIRFGQDVSNGEPAIIALANDVAVHPDYFRPGYDSDIALIQLTEPLLFSEDAFPARLPPADLLSFELADLWVQAAGWDETNLHNRLLLMIDLQIKSECCEFLFPGNFDSNKQVCMIGFSNWELCDRDAGGPITIWTIGGPVLLALASYTDGMCGDGGITSGTFVPAFVPWIQQTMLYMES